MPALRFNANNVYFSGNMVNFYSEFWMNCDTNLLIGTIQFSQALPVAVSLGSYGGQGSASLKPGQTLLHFELPVANYGSASSNELLRTPA